MPYPPMFLKNSVPQNGKSMTDEFKNEQTLRAFARFH